jgi:ATP-dependent protease ClpP protease subunit
MNLAPGLKVEGTEMKRLLQLFADNQGKPRDFRVVQAKGDAPAEIWLYDAIGGWDGILARDFIRELAGIDADKITLRINSPGGDVFEARAIVAALRDHKAEITARVDGLAASAASYIALAADNVQIVQGAFFMIHNAWSLVIGDKRDMTEMAGLLGKVDNSILDDYEEATGQTRDQLQAWMDAETWMTADEAKANGFADEIIDGKAAKASWNLAAYANAPAALQQPAEPNPGSPAGDDTQPNQNAAQAHLRRLAMLEKIG